MTHINKRTLSLALLVLTVGSNAVYAVEQHSKPDPDRVARKIIEQSTRPAQLKTANNPLTFAPLSFLLEAYEDDVSGYEIDPKNPSDIEKSLEQHEVTTVFDLEPGEEITIVFPIEKIGPPYRLSKESQFTVENGWFVCINEKSDKRAPIALNALLKKKEDKTYEILGGSLWELARLWKYDNNNGMPMAIKLDDGRATYSKLTIWEGKNQVTTIRQGEDSKDFMDQSPHFSQKSNANDYSPEADAVSAFRKDKGDFLEITNTRAKEGDDQVHFDRIKNGEEASVTDDPDAQIKAKDLSLKRIIEILSEDKQ